MTVPRSGLRTLPVSPSRMENIGRCPSGLCVALNKKTVKHRGAHVYQVRHTCMALDTNRTRTVNFSF